MKYACSECTGRSAGTVRPAATRACPATWPPKTRCRRSSGLRPRKISASICSRFSRSTRPSSASLMRCLPPMSDKLYHMGFRSKIPRSTLADANETHDWRIFADFAQHLIGIARPLHAEDSIGVDLDHTLYALDSTTIDLCLSLFPWAKFRQHKAAVKMHTLLDLHGNIPTFIHITEGKVHDSQYPRRDLSGGWRILRHGPGLHRFRAPQRVQPLLRIFRRAHERERSAAAALLPPG